MAGKIKKISEMTGVPEDAIIIYNNGRGQGDIRLYARDGKIWLQQQQIAKLFATSVPNISMHIRNILEEKKFSC
jgi:hypothetical protein